MMQKFHVCRWLGQQDVQPHLDAVQENGIWVMELSLEGLLTLAQEFDVMIQQYHGLPLLWIDGKGSRFRQV